MYNRILWWQVSRGFPSNVEKRSLDSLARTGQLPEYKRSLASLAKNGQLPEKLVQEKRMLDVLEQANDANSKAIHEQKNRVVQVTQHNVNPANAKNISGLLGILDRLQRFVPFT